MTEMLREERTGIERRMDSALYVSVLPNRAQQRRYVALFIDAMDLHLNILRTD